MNTDSEGENVAEPMQAEATTARVTAAAQARPAPVAPRRQGVRFRSAVMSDPECDVPTKWNAKDRFQTMETAMDDLRVSYKGPGKGDPDAASIRGDHPIPRSCGIFYFENTVVSKGREGFIGVGFCLKRCDLNRLPGWDRGSYGYHGDDGLLFMSTGQGKKYGPQFTTGDVVGCGLNFITNTGFFTRNGVHLGTAFTDLSQPLYPMLGMRTPGEVVHSNFGQEPFRFDFEGYCAEERQKVHQNISDYSVEPGVLSKLIIDYLMHHGYADTARQLSAELEGGTGPSPALDAEMVVITERQKICQLLREGNMDSLFECLDRSFPLFKDSHPHVYFRIKCQKFIELVRSGDMDRTLEYGQQELGSSIDPVLEDIFSLLAYPDPSNSPVKHLLALERRDDLATELNSALLVCQGKPGQPPLENIVRHLQVMSEVALSEKMEEAAILRVEDIA